MLCLSSCITSFLTCFWPERDQSFCRSELTPRKDCDCRSECTVLLKINCSTRVLWGHSRIMTASRSSWLTDEPQNIIPMITYPLEKLSLWFIMFIQRDGSPVKWIIEVMIMLQSHHQCYCQCLYLRYFTDRGHMGISTDVSNDHKVIVAWSLHKILLISPVIHLHVNMDDE